MTDTVLGIDVGTSGCRVAAYDPALREVAAATARYQVTRSGSDRVEIDADQVWAAVAGCLRTINAQLDRSPGALAIAVQGETVLPVGADGEAVAMAPISTDARAVAETAEIKDAVGARRLRVITGQPPHPMFSVGKIAWMRRIPELRQRAVKFHCLGDFLALRLGVPPAIDYTMAARTMAFDCHRQVWSAEILAAAGIPEKLMPPAVPVGAELGRLATSIADSLGFTQPPMLLAGAHDQACALLGAGATEAGQAALSLGTSECLTANVNGWLDGLADTSFPAYRPWRSDRWIVLAGIPSGGATLDWLAGMVTGSGEGDALGRLVDLLLAEPARVLALPHFAGSGTAENDPFSRGAFIGLSHSTSAGELFRAVLEASGFEVARSVAALTAAGIAISELRASGGGTTAGGPVQVRSTAAGLPLGVVPGHATARGAAMIAGAATGFYPSLSRAGGYVRPTSWVQPDPETQRWYRQQRKRYALLYPALRSIYHFPTGDDADEPGG
jgi:xylulokinase